MGELIIGVAVSGSHDGMYPLKWAVENLVTPSFSSLHLIHVYPPLASIPQNAAGEIPGDDEANSVVAAQMKQMLEMNISLFKMNKYKRYCRDRQVKFTVSLLERESIGEALVDHIIELGISKIVIGNGIGGQAISEPARYVERYAPPFCEVLIIFQDGDTLQQRFENWSLSSVVPQDWIEANQSSIHSSSFHSIELSSNNMESKAIRQTIMRSEDIDSLVESRREAQIAWKQAATLLYELKKTMKELEIEIKLRKDAEMKALQELASKQEILSMLRESQKTYTKYGFEELEVATNNFSEEMKLGEGGSGYVFKGTLRYTVSAIKVLRHDGLQGSQELQCKVELLSRIHHPHVVMMLGACPEKACIVYEYMANGSLGECLVQRPKALPWYIRFRVCYELASALMFLHTFEPEPIIHCNLKPENVLLDQNFVCKISDVGMAQLIPNNMSFSAMDCRVGTVPDSRISSMDIQDQPKEMFGFHTDVYALGIVILQILTGRPAIGITDVVEGALQKDGLSTVLDTSAGDWPIEEATELTLMGLQCARPQPEDCIDVSTVIFLLKNIQRVAEAAAIIEAIRKLSSVSEATVPSVYICPISQEVMKDPHMAADGFTYEYDHIKSWLLKHDSSPMTNLCLEHKKLMPNRSLRSAIQEWESKGGSRELH